MANSKGVFSNITWKFAERITAQIITLIVSIILARVLDPSHYGLISLVTIFITFANVFVSDGFGSALVQKKNADKIDFSSVFWFNLAFSIVLYFILFFSAPFIASFFGKGYELLTPVMRVLGLRIIFASINSVQQAYVARNMIFKQFFWATLFGTIVSAVVGISMAYSGFGVWALVGQYLTNTTIDTIVLAITLHKFPKFILDFKRLKVLLKYGWKILGVGLLDTAFTECRALIVGKFYSSDDLAFYDKGKQFPSLIVTNVSSSLTAVLFSKMSSEQDDTDAMKKTTKKAIRFSSYIMFPMMIGLLAVAKPFVTVVLTEKWLPCVPLLQLFCIIYLFAPIHAANLQAIKATGRSDIYLFLEIAKKIIELATLLAFMWISVDAIVISLAVVTVAFTALNAWPNRKLINYGLREQFKDMILPLIMSTFMGGLVYGFSFIPMNQVLSLCLQVVLGIVVYLVLSEISKDKEFLFLKRAVLNFFHHGRRTHKDGGEVVPVSNDVVSNQKNEETISCESKGEDSHLSDGGNGTG